MQSSVALTLTKWSLDVATRLVKANLRLHNANWLRDDMAILFVVNHFTRLETMLLPYFILRETGREVWSLAAAELFKGRVGQFLESSGTISTKAPNRDTIIIKSLLRGDHPWIIFPEGAMIKDKKVISHEGEFAVYNDGTRRAPHTGAAVLALRAEYYRHKIDCMYNRPGRPELQRALGLFGLENAEEVLGKRTVIVPVNITYYPIRAHDNVFLRIAERLAEDLSPRAMDELSMEGTVLSEDTDIDVTLGEPIDVATYLNRAEYASVMACGLNDIEAIEKNPGSLFNDAARSLMLHYMRAIYGLTRVNFDHIFATLLRHTPWESFSERGFRNRAYLASRAVVRMPSVRTHDSLRKHYHDFVFEDPFPKFEDFLKLSFEQKLLAREGPNLRVLPRPEPAEPDFHTMRLHDLVDVIANELEPLKEAAEAVARYARLHRSLVRRQVRAIFLRKDRRLFEEHYAKYYDPVLSKGPDVGRPFFLCPWFPRGGVVLCHGYMAAPLEVRALAQYLYKHGYAVYGARLAGHGTSPEDLGHAPWESWYESMNRGYAIIKTLTDRIFVGGFSTGGCLALLAAARKGVSITGAFSICAPLRLQSYSVRLAPSVVTLNNLLKRFGREGWEYVENMPENKHINYTRNPLAGVNQLVAVMGATELTLPQIQAPLLVVQGAKDPTVSPESAQLIFDKAGAPDKEMIVLERARHGIINGDGSETVFGHVLEYLNRLK